MGRYTPKFSTRLKSLLYENRKFKADGLLLEETILLDISFYQVVADFPLMIREDVQGVIIRAGQNTWDDRKAPIFMQGAKEAGMPIGSYWFYDSRSKPQDQAKLWKHTLGDYETPLLCWADYEERYGGPYRGWKHFYDFLEWCKVYMPERKFGIYTGYYYWVENSPNPITERASLEYFGKYPLWEAWYAPNSSYVKIPKPWTTMTFWQMGDNGDGVRYGVGSLNVDVNQYMGTKEQFRIQFDLENTGGGEMPEITYTGTVRSTVTAGAIVRTTPNGTDSGQRLAANEAVKVQGELVTAGVYEWANVVEPHQGWVATVLLNLTPTTPPPAAGLPDTLFIGTTASNAVEYTKKV